MEKPTESAMHAWLAVHDPVLRGPGGIRTAMAMDAVTAIAASGDTSLAPSNAQVTGANAEAALQFNKETQAALAAASGNTEDPNFLELFKNDLAGAAVTLSELARHSANYQPQTLDNNGANAKAYERYLVNMGSCPLFKLVMADVLTYNRESSDWNQVIDAIADTFEGVASEDKGAIVKGLKTLAQAASSKMSTQQTENVFVQSAMNLDGVVSLFLYSSKITFVETSGKGFDSKQSTYDIRRVKFELQTGLWPAYAAKVAAKFTCSVDDWLNNNTTSTAGTKAIPAFSQ
jgi:hypothetical protein